MKRLMLILAALMFAGSSAWAVPGALLQNELDAITTAPVAGDSSVDVTTDYIAEGLDAYWQQTASGGSVSTMIIELAGFASNNIFGVYDAYNPGSTVDLFAGSAVAGDQVTLTLKADGSVLVNQVDSGVDFTTNLFGFYLNSSYYANGGFWYSDTALNTDQADHMFAYQGTNTDTVQLPTFFPGLWTDNEFILAWEDLDGSVADFDYTDMVLMIESVTPVPEPATLILLGSGLAGLAAARRRKS